MGDLAGLTERIDYLAGIGVSVIWLMPFFPTPDRDDGYDITDFYGVDRRLGTHGQLVEVDPHARRSRHQGDHRPRRRTTRRPAPVVPSRTSRSRSPFHDWYVWVDEKPDIEIDVVFPGEQKGTVDLRPQGPAVRTCTGSSPHQTRPQRREPGRARGDRAQIIGFWLEIGVRGFRVGSRSRSSSSTPASSMRRSAIRTSTSPTCVPSSGGARRRDPAGRGQPATRSAAGASSATRMVTSFTSSSTSPSCSAPTSRSPARTRRPVEDALRSLPPVPFDSQWANFLRNHDELTLDQLTDDERQEVFDAFGAR